MKRSHLPLSLPRLAMSRRSVIAGAGAALMHPRLSLPAWAAGPQAAPLVGVNLAGAEFGNIPGQHGREYLYPDARMFASYAQQGFGLVRLPFKWERLEPRLGEPFAEQEMALLRAAVAAGTQHGMIVVLDPHNYAKRRLVSDGWSKEHVIGSDEVPARQFAQFWGRLAREFATAPLVHFGLMNEPTSIDAATWMRIAQEALDAIREAGASNRVYVPGVAYTGAHSWMRSGNHILHGLRDRGGDMVIEVHQYLDRDSSGTHAEAVSGSIGSERLAQFQTWAAEHGMRAFLGEFAAARDEHSTRALVDMLDEVLAHPEIWTGVAAWAGGPRWPPEDMYTLEPDASGSARPQTTLLSAFARGARPAPLFAGAHPALYLDRRRGDFTASARQQELLEPLSALFTRDAFTVIVDAHASALQAPAALLRSGEQAILGAAGGRFRSDIAGGLEISSPSGDAAQAHRVRCALSVDRARSQVSICATGTTPRTANTAASASAAEAAVSVASAVVRVIAFRDAFPPDALVSLVA